MKNPWIHIPPIPELINIRNHGPDKIIKTLQNMAIRRINDRRLLNDASEAFFEASDRLYPLQILKGLESFYKLRYSNEAILSSIIGRIDDLLPINPPCSSKRIVDLMSIFSRLNICHPEAINPLINTLELKIHDIENELSFVVSALSQLLIHNEKTLNLLATKAILTQKNHHLYSTFEAFTRHNINNNELYNAVISINNNDISIKSKIKLLSSFNRIGINDFNHFKNDIEKSMDQSPEMLMKISIWLNYYRLYISDLKVKFNLISNEMLPFQLLLFTQILDESHKPELIQLVQRLHKLINNLPTTTSILQCLQIGVFFEIKWSNSGVFNDSDNQLLSNLCNDSLHILKNWTWALSISEQRNLLDLLLYLKTSSKLNVDVNNFNDINVPSLLPLFPQSLKFDNLDIIQIGSKSYMSDGNRIHFYQTQRDRFIGIGNTTCKLNTWYSIALEIINSMKNYTLIEESI